MSYLVCNLVCLFFWDPSLCHFVDLPSEDLDWLGCCKIYSIQIRFPTFCGDDNEKFVNFVIATIESNQLLPCSNSCWTISIHFTYKNTVSSNT